MLRCARGIIACYSTVPGVNLTIRSMLWRSTPVEVCSRLRRFHIFGEKKTHLDYYQVFGVFSVFPFSCRPTLKLAWEASSLTVRHLFLGNFGNLANPWWYLAKIHIKHIQYRRCHQLPLDSPWHPLYRRHCNSLLVVNTLIYWITWLSRNTSFHIQCLRKTFFL